MKSTDYFCTHRQTESINQFNRMRGKPTWSHKRQGEGNNVLNAARTAAGAVGRQVVWHVPTSIAFQLSRRLISPTSTSLHPIPRSCVALTFLHESMNYRRLYSRRKLIGYSQRNGGIQRNSVVHSEHATRPQPRTIVNTDGIGGGLLRRRLLSILILAAAVSSSLSNAAAFRERPRHFIVRVTVVDVRLTIDTCRAGRQSLSDELSSWSFYDAGGVPVCIIYWGTIRAKRSLVDIHCRCPLLCRKLFSSVQSATASFDTMHVSFITGGLAHSAAMPILRLLSWPKMSFSPHTLLL